MKIAPDHTQFPFLSIRILEARYCVLAEWDHADLRAPYWRLYGVDRPGGRLRLPRQGWRRLQPGVLYLIPPEVSFSSSLVEPFGQLFVHFQLEGGPFPDPPQSLFALPAQPGPSGLPDCLPDPALPDTHPAVVVGAVARALTRLSAACLTPSSLDPRLSTVCAFVQGALHQQLSNEVLATHANMHPKAFARLFQQQIGTSPQTWVTARRIELACHLLHHSRLTIDAIAESCGFCDRFYFSRVFKNYRKKGPATFRAQSSWSD